MARKFGAPTYQHCLICEQERSFTPWVSYKVRHVFFIFRWVSDKTYTLACDICRRGTGLSASVVEQNRKKSPIPLFDRYGWAMGLALVLVLGVGVFVADKQARQHDLAYLANPTVNDIYEIDLARMSNPPKTDQEYSLMRVDAVAADVVRVQLSKQYCNKFGCASGDVTDGKAKSNDYYRDEKYVFSKAELLKMRNDGRITSVDR